MSSRAHYKIPRLSTSFVAAIVACLISGSASAEPYGACVVRDGFTDLVGYWDPDVARGYAKLNQASNDFDNLLSVCTDEVYAHLMQLYCSCAANPAPAYIQWEVATYNSSGYWAVGTDGTTGVVGCAASGCDYHSCEGIAPISCDTSFQGLIGDVDRLVLGGHLSPGDANGLNAKLRVAMASVDNGNGRAALNQLEAFANQVAASRNAGQLPIYWAEVLTDEANTIRDRVQQSSP